MKFSDVKIGECFINTIKHRTKDRFGLKTFIVEDVVFQKRSPTTGICMRPDPSVECGRRHEPNTLIIMRPDDSVVHLGIMEAAQKE